MMFLFYLSDGNQTWIVTIKKERGNQTWIVTDESRKKEKNQTNKERKKNSLVKQAPTSTTKAILVTITNDWKVLNEGKQSNRKINTKIHKDNQRIK